MPEDVFLRVLIRSDVNPTVPLNPLRALGQLTINSPLLLPYL